ncbi:MAG: PilT/PilU family type 4a pilus ATPase [Pseudomonadota bacterium]
MTDVSATEKARKYAFELMHLLANHNASDLYIAAGAPPMMRINGELRPVSEEKLMPPQTLAIVTSLMDQRLRDEFVETNEANFAVSVPDVSRFRINAYVQRGSVSMVVRQIATRIPPLEELGMPGVLRETVMAKRGLVFLVGATGQGKSTTLASLIDHRNRTSSGHIITIEDPVEYIHSHKKSIVSQREVGMDTDNFHIALKNALRQAPDVILIGEVRDREAMERAMEIAETGHLALCTLHANSTNHALERVASFFPKEDRHRLLYELSLTVRAIVSQRLIRKKDGHSRVPAVEIMLNTPLMTELIAKGDQAAIKSLMAKSRELGMQTFDQSLFDLISAGYITEDEGLRNSDSANDLRIRLKLADSGDADTLSAGIELEDVDDTEDPKSSHLIRGRR